MLDPTHFFALPLTQQPSGFLQRVRQLAGASGAALVAADGRWIVRDGAVPPYPIRTDLLHASGRVFPSGHGPGTGFLLLAPVPSTGTGHPIWLVLWDAQARPDVDAYVLLARITELITHTVLARHQADHRHRQALIERASATARIGIWSCTLPDEALVWSDGVYDLFELPRGSLIDRASTLSMYEAESVAEMQALRREAIATLGDFNFDARIITATGKQRWMRITATVDHIDGKARAIFGMKQNITEEKLLAERMRHLAETDALTGLANRSVFQARLDDLHGRNGVPVGALLLVDLDRFKAVNDTLGHVLGDACLAEAGRRLRQAAPSSALVARIGGDEFAILTNARDRLDLDSLCGAIVRAFDAPFLLGGQEHRIGASLGIAHRAEQNADILYRNADAALYAAKSAGRGTWRHHQAA